MASLKVAGKLCLNESCLCLVCECELIILCLRRRFFNLRFLFVCLVLMKNEYYNFSIVIARRLCFNVG